MTDQYCECACIPEATCDPTISPTTAHPTRSPTVQPTSAPSSDPTTAPTIPEGCDYWFPGPIPIESDKVLSTIMLYEAVNISFDLKTYPGWTCPADSFCNVLRFGSHNASFPKLPSILLRVNDLGNSKVKVVISDNEDQTAYIQFGNDEFWNEFNDGNYHNYAVTLSPSQLSASYFFEVTSGQMDISDVDYSDLLGSTGTEWEILAAPGDAVLTNGTIRHLCISSSPLQTDDPTQQPSLHPTVHPTRNPTSSPTKSPTKSPTFSPTKSPTFSPTKSPTFSPSKAPTSSPSASPSLPTSEPTDMPTYNISICDYWKTDVMEIQPINIVDAVSLYDNINILFYIRTEEHFTCSSEYCNFFRISDATRTVKIPNLSLRPDGQLQLGLLLNTGLKAWTLSNATFIQSHNDGQWHEYEMLISPTEVKLYYDAVLLLDKVGNFDASDYIGTNPTEYYIYSGATTDTNLATGYITNICIDTYATTPSPSSDPTSSPTADPTMYPISDSFSPSKAPTPSPTVDPLRSNIYFDAFNATIDADWDHFIGREVIVNSSDCPTDSKCLELQNGDWIESLSFISTVGYSDIEMQFNVRAVNGGACYYAAQLFPSSTWTSEGATYMSMNDDPSTVVHPLPSGYSEAKIFLHNTGSGSCYISHLALTGIAMTDNPTIPPTAEPSSAPTKPPSKSPTLDPTTNPTSSPTYISNQVTLRPDNYYHATDISVAFGTAAVVPVAAEWYMWLPWDSWAGSSISTDDWGIEVVMADQYQFTSGISGVSIEINGTCPNSECDLFWVCPIVHCSLSIIDDNISTHSLSGIWISGIF